MAYTRANPALTPQAVAGMGEDLAVMAQGKGTLRRKPDRICRPCMLSQHAACMGTAPGFIAAAATGMKISSSTLS